MEACVYLVSTAVFLAALDLTWTPSSLSFPTAKLLQTPPSTTTSALQYYLPSVSRLFSNLRQPATVASTSLSETLTQARSHLESLREYLPRPLQSLLPQPVPAKTNSLLSSILPHRLTSLLSHLSPEFILIVTLPLVAAALSMSYWRSYLGGYSPFASPAPRSPPTVTENDYHYIGPDDIVDPPTSTRAPRGGGPGGPGANDHWYSTGAAHHVSRADAHNPNAPDILVLRHRGTTYPLHFPAFSIGEGLVSVDELRRYTANVTDTPDPRRIKLLYKGKVLKDDAAACNAEGLKQNSELTCVVTEGPVNGGRERERERGGEHGGRIVRTTVESAARNQISQLVVVGCGLGRAQMVSD